MVSKMSKRLVERCLRRKRSELLGFYVLFSFFWVFLVFLDEVDLLWRGEGCSAAL